MIKLIKTITAVLLIGAVFTSCTKDETIPAPVPNQTIVTIPVTHFDIIGEWNIISGSTKPGFISWMNAQPSGGIDGYEFHLFNYNHSNSRTGLYIVDTYEVDDTTVVGRWYFGSDTANNTMILTFPPKGLKLIEFIHQGEPSIIYRERSK